MSFMKAKCNFESQLVRFSGLLCNSRALECNYALIANLFCVQHAFFQLHHRCDIHAYWNSKEIVKTRRCRQKWTRFFLGLMSRNKVFQNPISQRAQKRFSRNCVRGSINYQAQKKICYTIWIKAADRLNNRILNAFIWNWNWNLIKRVRLSTIVLKLERRKHAKEKQFSRRCATLKIRFLHQQQNSSALTFGLDFYFLFLCFPFWQNDSIHRARIGRRLTFAGAQWTGRNSKFNHRNSLFLWN